jgi:hypothetical protein
VLFGEKTLSRATPVAVCRCNIFFDLCTFCYGCIKPTSGGKNIIIKGNQGSYINHLAQCMACHYKSQ